ncbi:unnamed protein product [Effrenium voratum]|nr:unnamed protein product [Effrenium voratum]
MRLWDFEDFNRQHPSKVTYLKPSDATMAVKQLSGWYVYGRTMRVCLFRPEEGHEDWRKEKVPEKPCRVSQLTR